MDRDAGRVAGDEGQGRRRNANTFNYNADGLLTQEVEPVTATSSITTSFGYDMAGNRTYYRDGNNNYWWTTYNSWNLPATKVEPATPTYPAGTNSTFTMAYDADGRPATELQAAFVKRHAALITSIVVGTVVFAGCEAATLGIGSIGCAALAGAASSMASYAVTAAQTGHFSVGGLLLAGVTGAATAGLLPGAGAIAGRPAEIRH